MPSLGSILSIATSALQAHQKAINVTANNLSNAQTPGYTRQSAEFQPFTAQTTPYGTYGTGVTINDVRQIRDNLLDASYLKQTGTASEERSLAQLMARIEGILGEPGDGGIEIASDRFFGAASELATRPENTTVRTLVGNTAVALASRFRNKSADLVALRGSTSQRLTTAVDRVNTLTREIAKMNRAIVNSETTGRSANDLRDERRILVDELGSILPIQVQLRSNGSTGITSGGLSIVDGGRPTEIEVRNVSGTIGIAIVGRSGLLPEVKGTLGGLLRGINVEIPKVQGRLDDLAAALIADVNAIHQTGTGPGGLTGVDLFTGTGAGDIALSASVTANYDNIAAGVADGVGGYLSGTNDVAQALGQLRDKDDLGGLGVGFHRFHQTTVIDVAYSVRSREDAARVAETLAEHVDVQRESVSGVSTDEELVKLIQYQTGYQAAARVISVAQEMMDTLVAM